MRLGEQEYALFALVATCFLLWAGLWVWLFRRRGSKFTVRQGFVVFTGFVVIPALMRAAASPGRVPILARLVDGYGYWVVVVIVLVIWTTLVLVVMRTIRRE